MSIGPWQILIVVAVLLVLFVGRGKISSVMGDLAKGIQYFKKNMKDGEGAEASPRIEAETTPQPRADMRTREDETARG